MSSKQVRHRFLRAFLSEFKSHRNLKFEYLLPFSITVGLGKL